MEVVKERGICCGNEVYFNYVDGEVVMTMYKDVPGVRMDRRDPNVVKTFSRDDWGDINKYLMETLDKCFQGYAKREEVKEAESSPLFQQVIPEPAELPKANSIPKMTENDKEEVEEKNGEEDE